MPRGHPGQVKETTKKLGNHGNLPGPGPGRPKGVPNRINRDLKDAYLLAANLAGGKEGLVGYLKKQAELENPSAFMTGLSKLLPSVLEGNPDAPLSSSAFTTLGTVTHDSFHPKAGWAVCDRAHASACNETRHACHKSPDRSPSARPSGDDGG